jgi:CheY-like chemotaxis protein
VEGAGPETETPLGKLVDLHGVRVLLVDDDGDARQILLRFLHICGAETQEASNMAQALELITTFQPRVLLSDLGMPEHDGFELIRSVRQSGKSADLLPAIALTGFARSEDRHRALLAGFQMHMSKPIDPQELTAAIAMLVGRVN